MCGIVGYVGHREAQPVLLNCLSRLEYRGYDSCGIAVCNGHIDSFKDAGRIDALKRNSPSMPGNIGIGHTRWATHGLPTPLNAHPHFDCSRKIAVVHNGIISNYEQLRRQLAGQGHAVVSDTDTEVIPHLIEQHFRGDLLEAVEATLRLLEGSFAIAVVMDGFEGLIAGRNESPLVIGMGDNEHIVASDVTAFLDYTSKVIYLEDGDICRVSRDGVVTVRDSKVVERGVHRVDWRADEVGMDGYPHFMIKEIHEQPRVIRDALQGCSPDHPDEASGLIDSDVQSLLLLGCGTSYHAAMVGQHVIEQQLGIPSRVELGSEFLHHNGISLPSTAIAITQSGETADVLLAIKELKRKGTRVLVVTNVPGSTAARLADKVVFTRAGPEISVGATKTYIAQLMALYKLVLMSGLVGPSKIGALMGEVKQLPAKAEQLLANEPAIAECADFLAKYRSAFLVGRGINFPVALEGALKLKEISYIHAEGFAAGEMKHGPFALLDETTPVIALVTPDEVHGAMVSSIKEIKARSSPVIALVDERDDSIASIVDMVIKVPHTSSMFSPVVNAMAMQLLAYHAAKCRGCPVDYPRNLAKSVTVV